MNIVIIVGRLGRTPELQQTAKGVPFTRLSIATRRRVRSGETQTTWHTVTVWGQQAEHCCRYLTKGREAAVHGRLDSRKVESNGEAKHFTNIVAQQVQFLGSARDAVADRGPRNQEDGPDDYPDDPDDT